MKILKGAEVSAKIKEEVTQIAAGLQEVPKLAIIRVGENPDDMSYERGATKKMEAFGLRVESYHFPADISDGEFKKEFQKIVTTLADRYGVEMEEEKLLLEANKWELSHGGLSGRTAQQFIDYLLGQQ